MVQDLPKDLVKSMGDRAILYLDVDGEEPVISAVHPDGTVDKGLVRSRDVGCFLCSGSSSGVWAPDGSQFAFVALFSTRHVFVNLLPRIMTVPSGTVTSRTN